MKNINAFLGGRKYLWFFFISLLVLFNSCKKEPLVPDGIASSKKNKLGVTLSNGQEINNFEELDEYIKTYGITSDVNDKYFYFDNDLVFSVSDWDQNNNQPLIATQDHSFYFKKSNRDYLRYQLDYLRNQKEDDLLEYVAIIDPKAKNLDEVTIYGTSPTKDFYFDSYHSSNPVNIGSSSDNGSLSGVPTGAGIWSSGGGITVAPPPKPPKPAPKPKELWKDKNNKIIAWRDAGTKDWIMYNQLNDVNVVADKINYTYGILITNSTPPNISGGGRSGGTIDIRNSIKDPCLNSVWNKVKGNIDGEITKILNNVFGNNDKINLKITDGDIAGGYPAQTEIQSDKIINGIRNLDVKVTLNKSVLSGASQEYVATAIVHEIMHAYFDASNIDYGQQLAQHEYMAKGYIEALKNGVQEIYPNIGNKEAYALALNGFGDIFKKDLPYWNKLLEKYNLNNKEIINIRDEYKDPKSTTGTRCSN